MSRRTSWSESWRPSVNRATNSILDQRVLALAAARAWARRWASKVLPSCTRSKSKATPASCPQCGELRVPGPDLCHTESVLGGDRLLRRPPGAGGRPGSSSKDRWTTLTSWPCSKALEGGPEPGQPERTPRAGEVRPDLYLHAPARLRDHRAGRGPVGGTGRSAPPGAARACLPRAQPSATAASSWAPAVSNRSSLPAGPISCTLAGSGPPTAPAGRAPGTPARLTGSVQRDTRRSSPSSRRGGKIVRVGVTRMSAW